MPSDSQDSVKINVRCSHCREQLKIPKKYFGKKINCPTCKERFKADQIIVDEPRRQSSRSNNRQSGPQVMGYEEWMAAVATKPGAVGWTGPAYMVATLVGSLGAIAFLSPGLRRMRPKNYRPRGRKPGLIAMLPFLIIGTVVFFGLSPVFYFLYRRGALKQAEEAS